MPTSYTQEQIIQFEQTLINRQGVIQASFADQTVTFTSYSDALEFLAAMKRQEAAASGASTTRYAATSKGV